MHYAIRTPKRYIVAHDPETIEIVETNGRRERRKSLTTNVPVDQHVAAALFHYVIRRDGVLQRMLVRAGRYGS
jgi:hypothetical protein